ncbi:MAG TPA: PBP1A family penicillin-binding protein [Bryobacteraceae bacterium]|nr:PBP1A family penicillin-binding protein [Bryobacteraceae bacterium]
MKVTAAVSMALVLGAVGLAIPYHRLARRVDQQLAGNRSNTIDYYSSSEVVAPGDPMSPGDLAAAMKRAPGRVRIALANGRISSIVDTTSGRSLANYELKPQLLSSEEGRAKTMPVYFSELPPVLVHAILAAEDKRFFRHSGVDMLRVAKAVYVDLRERRKEQGASTITMQLARNLCLTRDKSWKRKMEEALITLHLEHKLSKNQILEKYSNLVYLGGDGAFGINGVGEAARAYFDKDVRKLNLPESATIAGLIQRPVYLNPFRYPARAVERRNTVLKRMRENQYIGDEQYAAAIAAPLGLHVGATELSGSQYFIDAAGKRAAQEANDPVYKPAAVYTTLDLRLEQAAERAIADGMQLVDKQLASRHGSSPRSAAQVALIALDPHTGEVKALYGGRNYAASQLDRVFAKRPPGSVFKPFVYTAALNTALLGGDSVLTPASMVDDSPTTFDFGNQTYNPANFRHEFMGPVMLRQAMAHSLNVASVKVAQMVGYQKVVAIAREAGMNDDIRPTPAVALGAYQVTPFEIARAYTIFANGGNLVQPAFIAEMRDSNGGVMYRENPRTTRVLDPRIAFLMVDMLQEVMRSGTAAGVRARGFRLPAAGKTGTSHDGWFAGFTSELLCVVWVGFDDYTDLGLEGAKSALPIWTEFMSEAARYKQYSDAKPFKPPQGVTQVSVDPQTGELSGPTCPAGVASYFVDGTQPQTPCMPQQVEIISTGDGGVVERLSPLQNQPAGAGAVEYTHP